jgi:hypothetical protein
MASYHDLFPIRSRDFESQAGMIRAEVINNVDAPAHGDRIVFLLEFPDGRRLDVLLSDIPLHLATGSDYVERAFEKIQIWLDSGSTSREIQHFR